MKGLMRSLRRLFKKRARDRGLMFTRDNIRIDRELDFSGDEICAYIEVWFDAEKKFGVRLPGTDYVNVYAYITPVTGGVRVTYIIYRADGSIGDERPYFGLTQSEKDLILEMAGEVSLSETGMTLDANWFSLQHEDLFAEVAGHEHN